MKKIILSALVVSMALGVQAQDMKDRKTEKPQRQDSRMGKRGHGDMAFKNLNLTENQKAAFKTQHENFRKQMQDLKKNDGITVKESREKMESLRKEHKAKIESLLTADQKEQIKKNKMEGKAKSEAMSKERSAKMKERLNLTDDQAAKMQKNRADMSAKMKTIRENKSLTDDQKKEKMKELMKQQKDDMKSILTEEQLNKMKEGKGNRTDRTKKVK